MNLDLNLLKTLISVAESKNFQEAAQRLGISQPAVSFQLRQLEEGLPAPLFYLSGRRKVLTHYGEALYETAKRQLETFRMGLEDLNRNYSDPTKLTLRIGGRMEILDFVSAKIEFSGKVELLNTSSAEAIRRLQNHEIDMAVSYQAPDSADLMAKKLFQSAAFFVAHKKLLQKRKLDLDLAKNGEFLRKTPVIVYQRKGHVLQDWIRHWGISLDELNIRYVVEDWRLVKNLVDRCAGYALIPEYIDNFHPDIQRLELPAKILPVYQFYAIYERGLKKDQSLSERA
jgi:DNA-binding transcriptional LysR family regulator